VLGTVVDKAGSIGAELAAALDEAGAVGQARVLAAAWTRRFAALVSAIGPGAPWRSTDDLNAEALADVRRTLMVAAHPWDLRAAAAQGLRTATSSAQGKVSPNRRTRSASQSPAWLPWPRACSPRRDGIGVTLGSA